MKPLLDAVFYTRCIKGIACTAGTEEAALIQRHSVGNEKDIMVPPKSALLVIDMQNDFINGTLPVAGGESIIPTINKLSGLKEWDYLGFTTDYHPANHISFASNSPFNLSPFESIDMAYTNFEEVCGEEYRSIYKESAAGNCSANDVHVQFSQELWPDHCKVLGGNTSMMMSSFQIAPSSFEKG